MTLSHGLEPIDWYFVGVMDNAVNYRIRQWAFSFITGVNAFQLTLVNCYFSLVQKLWHGIVDSLPTDNERIFKVKYMVE